MNIQIKSFMNKIKKRNHRKNKPGKKKLKEKKKITLFDALVMIITTTSGIVFVATAVFFVLSLKYYGDPMLLRFSFTIPAWTVLSVLFFLLLTLAFFMFKWIYEDKRYDSILRRLRSLDHKLTKEKASLENLTEIEYYELSVKFLELAVRMEHKGNEIKREKEIKASGQNNGKK